MGGKTLSHAEGEGGNKFCGSFSADVPWRLSHTEGGRGRGQPVYSL